MIGAKKGILFMNMDLNVGIGYWLGLLVNIISSSFASMLNAVFMRWNESKGVDIYYMEGSDKH